nr:PE-PPE domain-containing protein [Gordonia sp. NB41Y]
MNRIRKTLGTTAVGCALCLGAVVPMALSSTPALAAGLSTQTADELGSAGVFRPTEAYVATAGARSDWLRSVVPGLPDDAIVVVTPGTDDGTLYQRIQVLRTNDRPVYIIDYPESLGPVVSGRTGLVLPFTAPTYDESRDIAVAKNLQAMSAFGADPGAPSVVYSGYSQGAEAVGNAAEQAVATGGIDTQRSTILLVSDPRSPWGLKNFAAENPLVGSLFELLGAESNGARDPGATGDDLDVVSVIIVGDPASDFQWVWYRPVSSLVVDLAGFLTIHAGGGSENYATVEQLGEPTELHSTDGNTTYLVYHTAHHPLTLLTQMILTGIGITPSEADLERWDKANNAFYPLQEPTPANAGVAVDSGPRDAASPAVARSASAPTGSGADDPGLGSPAITDTKTTAAGVTGGQAPEVSGGRHQVTVGQQPTVSVPASETAGSDPGTGRHHITGSGRHAAPEPTGQTASTDSGSDPEASGHTQGAPTAHGSGGGGAASDTATPTTATEGTDGAGVGGDGVSGDDTDAEGQGSEGPGGAGTGSADAGGDGTGGDVTEQPAA